MMPIASMVPLLVLVTAALCHATPDPMLTNEVVQPQPPPTPPRVDPATRAAQVARFIVHFSSWGSLSHISRQPGVSGSPVARVYSTSDGPNRDSSGTPYFYMCPEDPGVKDMMVDPRASLTMTLAQSPYCQLKNLDPEDPRCPQVVLTGTFVILQNTTKEYQYGLEAMFTRHPEMKFWAKSNPWLTCKLNIQQIMLVDEIGPSKYPSLDLYYKVKPDVCSSANPFLDMPYYF